MYRLDAKSLSLTVEMAAWRAFRKHGAQLHSKASRGRAELEIIAELKEALINDHTCVVVTGISGFSMSTHRLRFGVDEPWPAPLEIEAHEQ